MNYFKNKNMHINIFKIINILKTKIINILKKKIINILKTKIYIFIFIILIWNKYNRGWTKRIVPCIIRKIRWCLRCY